MQSSFSRSVALATPLLLIACQHGDDPNGTSKGDTDTASAVTIAGDPCGVPPADDTGFASLFDPGRVHTIALSLTEDAATALAADPGTAVEGDVVIDGAGVSGVGVGWRGDSAQKRWDGKPGFRLDLHAMGSCQSYAGISTFVLDSMVDDPAQLRAVVASEVLAALDVPAPRATWAEVTVDGADLGLYALLEPVDAGFLDRRFSTPDAGLWEGSKGADFTGRGRDDWELVTGVGDGAVLDRTAQIVEGDGADFYADVSAEIDMDAFFGAWAGLAAVGDPAPYPYDTDDVAALVADDGRLRLLPSKVSGGWDPEFDWRYVKGALAVRCSYDAECFAGLRGRLATTLQALDAIDTTAMVDAAVAVSADAVAADPRRPTLLADVTAARDALASTIEGWPDTLRSQAEP